MVQLPQPHIEDLSNAAARVSAILADLRKKNIAAFDSDEKRILLRKATDALDRRLTEFDATGCSRLAWLHLQLGNAEQAQRLALRGCEMEPTNQYCRSLVERLAGH
jgi:hypothetical protein